MQKNSKLFEYKEHYRHNLGGDDFALRPCSLICFDLGFNYQNEGRIEYLFISKLCCQLSPSLTVEVFELDLEIEQFVPIPDMLLLAFELVVESIESRFLLLGL